MGSVPPGVPASAVSGSRSGEDAPHVGGAYRAALRALLTRHGYRFVKGNDDVHGWGHGPIDDFYVLDEEHVARSCSSQQPPRLGQGRCVSEQCAATAAAAAKASSVREL